jgi:hypothetical protein
MYLKIIGGVNMGNEFLGERDRRDDVRGADTSLLFFFLLLVIIFCNCDFF